MLCQTRYLLPRSVTYSEELRRVNRLQKGCQSGNCRCLTKRDTNPLLRGNKPLGEVINLEAGGGVVERRREQAPRGSGPLINLVMWACTFPHEGRGGEACFPGRKNGLNRRDCKLSVWLRGVCVCVCVGKHRILDFGRFYLLFFSLWELYQGN